MSPLSGSERARRTRRLLASGALLATALLGAPSAHAQEADEARGAWFAGERGFAAKLVAGPALHRLHDFWVISGDLEVGVGSQTRSGGWFGTLGGRIGSSDGGLQFRQVAIGPSWEAPIDPRWHVGLGADVSIAWFNRVSVDGSILSLGLGGRAFTSYDLVHDENIAVFLGLELGADAYLGDDATPLYGGGLRLGARLF